MAMAEAKNWKFAQIIPEAEEDAIAGEIEDSGSVVTDQRSMQLRCQVDASWTHEDRKTGLGFVLSVTSRHHYTQKQEDYSAQ